MSSNSNIEWTEATWNILGGCTKCSIGCEHCFAERMTHRLEHNPQTSQYHGLTGADGHWTGEVRLFPGKSQEPRGWKKPRRVFVQSMGDLFHEKVPVGWITHVLDTIQACPQHTFLMLTKRPENMRKALYSKWDRGNGKTWQYMSEDDIIPNLWLGVTVCNQEEADAKIPLLLQIPAAVRWVSMEPLLGPVDLSPFFICKRCVLPACSLCVHDPETPSLDWVVCGAETGPGKRLMDPDWARQLRDQCSAVACPFSLNVTALAAASSTTASGMNTRRYPNDR